MNDCSVIRSPWVNQANYIVGFSPTMMCSCNVLVSLLGCKIKNVLNCFSLVLPKHQGYEVRYFKLKMLTKR